MGLTLLSGLQTGSWRGPRVLSGSRGAGIRSSAGERAVRGTLQTRVPRRLLLESTWP